MSPLSPIQRNHASSLLPSSLHDPKLLHLLSLPVSLEIIEYLATVTHSVIGEVIRPSLPTPPAESAVNHKAAQDTWLPNLEDFIHCVCSRSNVQMPTLVCTIIFLNRLRAKLPAKATGVPGTAHRLFLASLIVSAKYANDSSPRNKHWVLYADLFDLGEINLMEKQLLFLLDFDLGFDELETIANVQPLLDLIYDRAVKPPHRSDRAMLVSPPVESCNPELQEQKARVRGTAIQVVSRASQQRVERQSRPAPVPISIPRVQYPPGLPTPASARAPRQPPIQRPPKRKSTVVAAPVAYTNVHMRSSSSDALNDVLSRGPSTDSVDSSFSSRSSSDSGGLTEDNGTSSSSSAAYSSDEYEYDNDDIGIVRVHASLRPAADEMDISSLSINDENLNRVEAGLAGIGTLVGTTSYSEVVKHQRPQRTSVPIAQSRRRSQPHFDQTQPQTQARGEEQEQKSLRPRKTIRRNVASTFLPSSDSEGERQYRYEDDPYHPNAQRSADSLLPGHSAYASSSSTITAITAHRHSNSYRYSTSQAQRYSVAIASATPASTPVIPPARNMHFQARPRPIGSRPAPAPVAFAESSRSQVQQNALITKHARPSYLVRSFSGMGVPVTSASASAASASGSGYGPGKNKPAGFGASLRSLLGGSIGSVNDASILPRHGEGSRGRGATQR